MTRERRWSVSSCVLAALALPRGAPAEEIRLGNEFQANTYTTDYQHFPSVAADGDGEFVVAWESLGGRMAPSPVCSLAASRTPASLLRGSAGL